MKYVSVKIIEAVPMEAAIANMDCGYRTGDAELNDPGYEVTYQGGYKSWCPKNVFDLSSHPCGSMPFGHAIEALKSGKKVCRNGWNGKGMWLELQVPDAGSKMSLPYIYMKTADDNLVPWLASQTDVLSNDWMLVD